METSRTFLLSKLTDIIKTLLGLNNRSKQEEQLVLQPEYVKK